MRLDLLSCLSERRQTKVFCSTIELYFNCFRDALQSDEVADDLESRFKAFYEVCERRGEDDSPVQNVEKKKPLSPKISKELQAFICPITQDIMNDPVTCMDGHTYEKEAIQKTTSLFTTNPDFVLNKKHVKTHFSSFFDQNLGL